MPTLRVVAVQALHERVLEAPPQNAALDLLGPAAQLKPGRGRRTAGGRFERSYRYTVVDTIGGGTSEIQKNIIARRKLGLPANF